MRKREEVKLNCERRMKKVENKEPIEIHEYTVDLIKGEPGNRKRKMS